MTISFLEKDYTDFVKSNPRGKTLASSRNANTMSLFATLAGFIVGGKFNLF